jgi:phosphohistidine phosphatase
MLVCLFRHGIAIDPDDPDCPSEPERWLTDEGIEKTRAAARGLERLGLEPGAVLSSPFVRARQTAEIAIEALGLKKLAPTVTRALLPDADPGELRRELAVLDVDAVLCVGHAPQLDRMIAHLVGSPVSITQLKKAGAAIVDVPDVAQRRGVLIEVLTNRTLRRLG